MHTLSILWKVIASVIAGVVSVIGAEVALRSALDRIRNRYDEPILELLRGRENVAHVLRDSDLVTPVLLIAEVLKRRPKQIHKSLLRLEANNKAHQEAGGWQFGPIPSRSR